MGPREDKVYLWHAVKVMCQAQFGVEITPLSLGKLDRRMEIAEMFEAVDIALFPYGIYICRIHPLILDRCTHAHLSRCSRFFPTGMCIAWDLESDVFTPVISGVRLDHLVTLAFQLCRKAKLARLWIRARGRMWKWGADRLFAWESFAYRQFNRYVT